MSVSQLKCFSLLNNIEYKDEFWLWGLIDLSYLERLYAK